MDESIIKLDSERGKELDFTSENFDGYLWQKKDEIIISIIISFYPGKHNLLNLFNKIRSEGFHIFVPTPSGRMSRICDKYGMIRQDRIDGLFGIVHGFYI
jgi:hypothetical protein